MKQKYKIQIIIGVILSIILIILSVIPKTNDTIIFAEIERIILSLQILYLTIIVVLNTSDKNK